VAQTWQALLKHTSAQNLNNPISFFLSIPPSNSNPERAFSIFAEKWRENHNRAHIELLSSDVAVYICEICTPS